MNRIRLLDSCWRAAVLVELASCAWALCAAIQLGGHRGDVLSPMNTTVEVGGSEVRVVAMLEVRTELDAVIGVHAMFAFLALLMVVQVARCHDRPQSRLDLLFIMWHALFGFVYVFFAVFAFIEIEFAFASFTGNAIVDGHAKVGIPSEDGTRMTLAISSSTIILEAPERDVEPWQDDSLRASMSLCALSFTASILCAFAARGSETAMLRGRAQ